jgi:hypothetical protein
VSFEIIYQQAKFGAIGRSCFVIASLKLLKDIEYLENKWKKENGPSLSQQAGLAPNPTHWSFSSMRSHLDRAALARPMRNNQRRARILTTRRNAHTKEISTVLCPVQCA